MQVFITKFNGFCICEVETCNPLNENNIYKICHEFKVSNYSITGKLVQFHILMSYLEAMKCVLIKNGYTIKFLKQPLKILINKPMVELKTSFNMSSSNQPQIVELRDKIIEFGAENIIDNNLIYIWQIPLDNYHKMESFIKEWYKLYVCEYNFLAMEYDLNYQRIKFSFYNALKQEVESIVNSDEIERSNKIEEYFNLKKAINQVSCNIKYVKKSLEYEFREIFREMEKKIME